MGKAPTWTPAELKVVRTVYVDEGLLAAMQQLPGRNAGAIFQKAFKLGLKCEAQHFPEGRYQEISNEAWRLRQEEKLSYSAIGGAYARALAARTQRSNAAEKGYLSLDDLIRKYERSPEFKARAENTKTSYSRYLAVANRLIRTTEGGSPAAAALKPTHVVQLRDQLADTPGAANQAVRALGALYAWASRPEQGYAASNPAAKITLFQAGEHQPWPEPLLEEALADPAVRLPVALLYFTGQRIGDVVRMQWNDVEGGEIRVFAQKTRSRLWIALAGELAALLSDVRSNRTTATAILTNEQGRPWTQSGLRQKLQAWALERGHKVVPHGLRKNAVIALLEAGCTVAEVSSITAHSIAMVEHYGKGRDQRRIGRGAIVKLDEHRKAKA